MKKLKIFFSPSVEDMLAAENSTERSADFVYKLTCTTVYKLADLPSSKDIQVIILFTKITHQGILKHSCIRLLF